MPAGDGVVKRRDFESINCGVACLCGRRLVGKILLQGANVAEKSVREDVLLRAVAEQHNLNVLAALQARGAKRRDEDQGLEVAAWREREGRRLIHVDALIEQKLHD